VLTAAYLGVLIYLDRRDHLFDNLAAVRHYLPALVAVSLTAYALRYARWMWLLRRHGFGVPWLSGLLAYLAGFALTASPGRVGELVRIRYFARLSVPAEPVVACFIFERSCDLFVILLLALLIGSAWSGLWITIAFVAALLMAVSAVVIASRSTRFWHAMAYWPRRYRWPRTARTVRVLGRGISRTAIFFNPAGLSGSILFGAAIWGLQALGFVYLITNLGLALPIGVALAVFPLSTLIGTMSMVPGGIGATEAAITFLLSQLGAALETAAFAAVAMRLCTHWFAIVLGLVSAAVLEICAARNDRVVESPQPFGGND
jgi:uncharacterized protein (TIRG00374 family)